MKPPHTHTNCSKYSLFFFLIIGCTFIILTKHVFSFFSSFHCTIKLAHDMVSKPQLLLLFNILFGWSVWIFGWGEIMVSDVVMGKQYDHWLSNDTIDNQATNITYNANTNNCDIHTLIGHFFVCVRDRITHFTRIMLKLSSVVSLNIKLDNCCQSEFWIENQNFFSLLFSMFTREKKHDRFLFFSR